MTTVVSIISLPWPSRDLHPNARVHWGQRARAAKKARTDGAMATRAAGVRQIDADRLKVTATFCPPDRRARDEDGMLSSVKSYFDGIADVIGVDDSRWSIHVRRDEPVKHGAVNIEIEVQA